MQHNEMSAYSDLPVFLMSTALARTATSFYTYLDFAVFHGDVSRCHLSERLESYSSSTKRRNHGFLAFASMDGAFRFY